MNVMNRKCNLFAQKCACCTQVHCTRCLMPRTDNYDGRPACNKCAVLANGDYTRDFLAVHYTLRELRAFLSRRRVNIDGCTEKNDVIEVLMQMRRTSAAHNEEEEHRRHILLLKVELTVLFFEYVVVPCAFCSV